MVFSSRLPRVLSSNVHSQAIAARRAAGVSLLDLTDSNPTDVGISYPPDLLSSLADPQGLHYTPEPRGLAVARQAVADDRWPGLPPDRIVLTASTSEAYAVLFKLLADPGDEVLVPQPSYPLFDLLTRLDAIEPRPYWLEYHGVWSIDRDSVEQALSARTRAVLVVSPNNPTGSRLRTADREWLAGLCAARGIALIADEVFDDYILSPRPDAASLADESRALTFVLGGLSKSAGLPQLKVAWTRVNGPESEVAATLARLDLICDTYLSVSTPVQIALRRLLEAGRSVRARILERVRRNLDHLRRQVTLFPAVRILEPEGGWSVVLRVPATRTEEALTLEILDRAGVIVHPGYFFDFRQEAFLVVSLLPEPASFDIAIARLLPIAAHV